jgi:hypothetical protein
MGQEVTTKQNIGTVATDEELSSMELQVWKGISKLNPVDWLAR